MSQRRAEKALTDYLDRLLSPIPENSPRPLAEPDPTPTSSTVLLPAARRHLQQLLDQVSEKPVLAPEQIPEVMAVAIPLPVTAVAVAVANATVTAGIYTNDQYRQDLPARFPTLVFRIDGLKLALPLHLLGGILRRDKPLTPLVGRAEWFLGLLAHDGGNINVVDTGRYLLGDKYRPELVDDYQYVIRIGDSPWGLACTDLCSTRNLSQDEMRWYDTNPRRPWLAGIIKDDRCAFLNTRALVDAFEQPGLAAA